MEKSEVCMNSKEELVTQNMQDCWSILYKNLTKTFLYRHGKSGETVIRSALHLCGVKLGSLEQDAKRKAQTASNLESLFLSPSVLCADPRFRIQWQILGEEEAVFDVLTCPVYDRLAETGDLVLMLPLCEEFHHGVISGYTDGAGQCCLSENFIYSEENSCRLGCYFRAANIPAKKRAACFTGSFRERKHSLPKQLPVCLNPRRSFSAWASALVTSYLEESEKKYGHEALCTISEGLRNAASETAAFLTRRAFCTGHKSDEEFLSENTFWYETEDLSGLVDRDIKLISLNYICNLKKETETSIPQK